jgi:hypothetical protein
LKSNQIYKNTDKDIYEMIKKNKENNPNIFKYFLNPKIYGPLIPTFVSYISVLDVLPKKFHIMYPHKEKNIKQLIQILSDKTTEGSIITIIDHDCETMDFKKFISLGNYFYTGHLRFLPLKSMIEWKYLFELNKFKSIGAKKSEYHFEMSLLRI